MSQVRITHTIARGVHSLHRTLSLSQLACHTDSCCDTWSNLFSVEGCGMSVAELLVSDRWQQAEAGCWGRTWSALVPLWGHSVPGRR